MLNFLVVLKQLKCGGYYCYVKEHVLINWGQVALK